MENVIETNDLCKTYKDFKAVDHLNLHIPEGSVYGFIGPNGAGKSTTMKMMLGMTRPTAGRICIMNLDPEKEKEQILKHTGSFIEQPTFYPNLSGEENLKIIQKILDLEDEAAAEVLELVGLSEFRHRLVKKYSLGMKQRLALAMAFLGKPQLLILDEPTNGLDPAGIHEIRQLIQSLPKRWGCTVLISSHLLSEVEQIADYIGILNHGHLLYEGSLDNLRAFACDQGMDGSNLENLFLQMIDKDNKSRQMRNLL